MTASHPGTAIEQPDGDDRSGPVQRLRRRIRLLRDGSRFAVDAREGKTVPPPERPVRIAGLDPVRVLLVGGDYAIGFGAPDRATALDGAIAEALHAATGRGVTVENRSRDRLRLRDLHASLGASGAYTHDLVVWAPSFAEAGRLLSLRPWRDGVACMLHVVRTTSEAGTVLLGIPQLGGAQPLARVARWRAAQINAVLRRTADEDGRAFFVEPGPLALRDLRDLSGPEVYRDAARTALPAMLEAWRSSRSPRSGEDARAVAGPRCSSSLLL